MSETKPYPGTQAVVRAFAILKAFTDERPSWGLTDLAQEVGLNKTTTYRLLTALESEGMISRDGASRNGRELYTLGPETVVLGGRAQRQNNLRTVARPYLEQMAQQSGETASLDLLIDNAVLIFDEVIGDRLVGSVSSLGTRHPAYATSTGKAIMACLPEAALAALLVEPLTAITPHTITDTAVLHQQLAEIRSRGYAIADQELEDGLVVVAAPLHNYDGQPTAAISLGGPAHRFTPTRTAEIGALVQQTAVAISNRLGYRQ